MHSPHPNKLVGKYEVSINDLVIGRYSTKKECRDVIRKYLKLINNDQKRTTEKRNSRAKG